MVAFGDFNNLKSVQLARKSCQISKTMSKKWTNTDHYTKTKLLFFWISVNRNRVCRNQNPRLEITTPHFTAFRVSACQPALQPTFIFYSYFYYCCHW